MATDVTPGLGGTVLAALLHTGLLGISNPAQAEDASAPSTGNAAAEQPAPCSAPEARQFDFWLGEWDLSWDSDGDGERDATGTNVVASELGGCVSSHPLLAATSPLA